MQNDPKLIAVGDFLYFAPGGKAFTVPESGTVSATSKPGALDELWMTYLLGNVKDAITTDKVDTKPVIIKQALPGTGLIVPNKVLRTDRSMSMEATMIEMSRTALAGFYQSEFIEPDDESFNPLGGSGSIEGWLKRQRYDQDGELVSVDDWWVDLTCELVKGENNIIHPKFTFQWLYSPLAGSAIPVPA